MGDDVARANHGDVVECHSGFVYAERPVALYWEGRRLVIVDVLDKWLVPDGRCFRVLTADEREFKLFYSESDNEWHIQPI